MVDDVYLDDRERAEKVKQWWKENGLSIVGGAALGLVAIFGWRTWQAHELAQARAAATEYQQFVNDAPNLSTEEIGARVQMFEDDFGRTPYAAMAALEGGLLQYRTGFPDKAEALYEYAAKNGEPAQLRDVARLRLARLHMDQGEFDKALSSLEGAEAPQFKSLVEELRGDIQVQQGDDEAARTSYQAALADAGDGDTRFLELKLASLGSGIIGPKPAQGGDS